MVDEPQNSPDWTPTPKQAAVLEAAMNAGLKRNLTKICKEAGVDRKSLYKWRKEDPNFRTAWNELWKQTVDLHFNGVIAAQIARAEAGRTDAARLLAEIKGVVKKRVELTGEAGGPVQAVVDYAQLTKEQLEALSALKSKQGK